MAPGSDYALIVLEQGLRVAAHQIVQDDRTVVWGKSRQFRVIRGLACNAQLKIVERI